MLEKSKGALKELTAAIKELVVDFVKLKVARLRLWFKGA
jgi:hypothetical protein